MKHLVCLAILALAACEPKPEEPALDGAPELDGAPAGAPEVPGDLGAGAPAAPAGKGVIDITPPMGVQQIDNCETVIAATFDGAQRLANVQPGAAAAVADVFVDRQRAVNELEQLVGVDPE